MKEKPIEIKKVISIIEGIVGGKSVIRIQQRDASDIDATWANIERARALLEWHPNVNLEKGSEKLNLDNVIVTWGFEWAAKCNYHVHSNCSFVNNSFLP